MQDEQPGTALVVPPDGGRSWWQPVPANGFAEVRLSSRNLPGLGFASGVQHVAPGGHIREHVHPTQDEVLFVFGGEGTARIDGIDHPLVAGTTIYVGRGRPHMFLNTGTADLQLFWLLQPGGLEDFFERIGRPRTPGEPAPAPFPRPDDVLEIERQTVFLPLEDEREGARDEQGGT